MLARRAALGLASLATLGQDMMMSRSSGIQHALQITHFCGCIACLRGSAGDDPCEVARQNGDLAPQPAGDAEFLHRHAVEPVQGAVISNLLSDALVSADY